MYTFKTGDAVKVLDGSPNAGRTLNEGEVYTITGVFSDMVTIDDPYDPDLHWFASRFELLTVKPAPKSPFAGFTLAEQPAPVANDNADQAMRFNNSKSDLAYFLTFDGGVDMLLYEPNEGYFSRFIELARTLSRWYRLDTCDGSQHEELFEEMVVDFHAGTESKTLAEDMIKVCEFGAKKYARGNYLKGRGFHDTCNSLLRHMLQDMRGEALDPESNCKHEAHIEWNICFLRHCFNTFGAKFDDRIRAPKAVAS